MTVQSLSVQTGIPQKPTSQEQVRPTITRNRDTMNDRHLLPSPPPQPFYGPFFRDHPGEPVPEENFWTSWCKGRLIEADTPIIRLGATPSRLISAHFHHTPIFFYRPDARPAAKPTASKH